MQKTARIYKKIGETPLEALENFRAEQIMSDADNASTWKTIPMTYAGRLDPMAEGELLILIGDECKNKEKYLGLNKEYEVEVVFGISTDTYDALGLVIAVPKTIEAAFDIHSPDLTKYVGKFTQPYPPYSSKTVDGVQLHTLARDGDLPADMPNKEVEIYEIELLETSKIAGHDLKARIFSNIDLVKGDFRQKEIKGRWDEILNNNTQLFDMTKIRVKCSSGTYMRSLAERIGKDAGGSAFALSIKRTKIFSN